MNNSRVNTVRAPVVSTQPRGEPGAEQISPALIVSNATRDCVVRVRNLGYAADIYVAFDAAALLAVPASADVWVVPAGETDQFVVAKGQSLHCTTPTGGVDGSSVMVSYHVYQSLPTVEAPNSRG